MKQKRSDKLYVKKRCAVDLSEELLRAQKKFFDNEDMRAEERHQQLKTEMELKIEILKKEKEIKDLEYEKLKYK